MKGIRPGKLDKPIPPTGSLLTVLWQVEMDMDGTGKRYSQWMCQCKCGKSIKVRRVRIQNGHTKSCGCLLTTLGRRITWAIHAEKKRRLADAR